MCFAWIWSGIGNTFYKGIKGLRSRRQDYIMSIWCQRRRMWWSLQTNNIYALCQSHKHYWRFFKKLYARDEMENSSGMESCGSIPNIYGFLFWEKKKICSSHTITSHDWWEETLTGEFFVLFCFVLEFYDAQKSRRKQNVFNVRNTCLGSQNKSFFPFQCWPLFGRCWFFFFPFLPVVLMELEINMAFCLPPNLCAAIINVVSRVLGIGFVYSFCYTSKWRNAKKKKSTKNTQLSCSSHFSLDSPSSHKNGLR